jgi:molybdenum cofactor cytidylyltransferase
VSSGAGTTYQAVVLAAGRGSRAGGFKPGLDCGGVPLLVHTVRAFAGVCDTVWVVTGHRSDDVAALVAHEAGVEVVFNPDWTAGMFTSVQAGVRRVTADRFFVTPGDLPLLDPGVVRRLCDTEGDLVSPVYDGQGGHPVLLGRRWAGILVAAPGSSRLRDVLADSPRTTVDMDDDAVLRDIDTCEDYEDYLERTQRRTSWALT